MNKTALKNFAENAVIKGKTSSIPSYCGNTEDGYPLSKVSNRKKTSQEAEEYERAN